MTFVDIPTEVKSIGEYAFGECKGLRDIKIPSSVTMIGKEAFLDCENLNVEIENTKENVKIGEDAFKGCKSIKFTKN